MTLEQTHYGMRKRDKARKSTPSRDVRRTLARRNTLRNQETQQPYKCNIFVTYSYAHSARRRIIDMLGSQPMLVFRSTSDRSWALPSKRTIDFVGALIGLILLFPLMHLGETRSRVHRQLVDLAGPADPIANNSCRVTRPRRKIRIQPGKSCLMVRDTGETPMLL